MTTESENTKKVGLIKDKNGMWWCAGDIDNLHDRLHELLKEKAENDPTIVQCSFCGEDIKGE